MTAPLAPGSCSTAAGIAAFKARLPFALRGMGIAAMLWAAGELLRAGAADFLRLEPCARLDAVRETRKAADPAMLEAARSRLELARSIDPRNPIVHEYLGLVHLHRAHLVRDDRELSAGYLQRADAYYRQAVELRPHSPHLWAALAVVASDLLEREGRAPGASSSERTEALSYAVSRATALGPWEPEVLSAVARAARPHYAALGDTARETVDEAVRRLRLLGTPPSVRGGGDPGMPDA